MATHKGSEGVVKVGSNTISEILSYSITETADLIEDTQLSDTSKTYLADLTSASGSLECSWDETDTNGQEALTVGASVTLNLYPEGASTGDQYGTCTALITSVGVSTAIGSTIKRSFNFTVNGAITWGAVA